MKKIVLLLLLMASPVVADGLDSLSDLQTAVYDVMNIPSTGTALIDSLVARRAINLGVTQVSYDFPAVEKLDTIITADGTRYYALNTDFVKLHSCVRLVGDSVMLPLQYPPVSALYEIAGGLKGAQQNYTDIAIPRYSWVFNDLISFYPPPDKVDTFIVSYYAEGTQLLAADSTTDIKAAYRGAVVDFACHLLSMRKGQFNEASAYLQIYNQKLAIAQGTSVVKKDE